MEQARFDNIIKAVKLFNYVAGVLIVAGAVFLIVKLWQREDREMVQEISTNNLHHEIMLPKGYKIDDVRLEASRAILILKNASGPVRLMVIDLSNPKNATIIDFKEDETAP